MSIFREVNALRTAHGLPRARYHLRMARIAQRHARAMRRAGIEFHNTDPPPSDLPAGWTLYGECVAHGPERRLVRAWRRSSTHRRVLLLPDWTHLGVGVAYDRHGDAFVAACFVTLP